MQIETAKAEIEELSAKGLPVSLVSVAEQPYVMATVLEAPTPPWDRASYDIMVAIPLVYDLGTGLDGFYLRLPYTWNGGVHNRVNGGTITYDGSTWQLVSWHYVDGKPFRIGVDTIDSHIVHCRGFFSARGATNAKD